MHRETKHTAISKRVKTRVWLRDGKRCIVCRQFVDINCANSHVVRRARGGLGIDENIVTHCRQCHLDFDSFKKHTVRVTMDYIKKLYPEWDRERVVYKKHGENNYQQDADKTINE